MTTIERAETLVHVEGHDQRVARFDRQGCRVGSPGSWTSARSKGSPRNLGGLVAPERERSCEATSWTSGEMSECRIRAMTWGNSSGGPCRAKRGTEEQNCWRER